MKVKGLGAVVTGAGRGLGEALARELAVKGARVVLVARDLASVEKVATEIRALGGTAFALSADVGSKRDVYPLAGAAAALVGSIDVLIHNASTLGPLPMPLLMDTECEDLQRVLDVNLVGPFRLTKAVAGNMVLRRSGVVVHLSSDAAVNAYPNWGAYAVSKAAQDHLMRTLAAELAETGVRFVSVDPGEMDTRMHADAMPDADRTTLRDPRRVAARLVAMIEDEKALPNGARKEVSL